MSKKIRYLFARPFEKIGTKFDVGAYCTRVNELVPYYGYLGGLLWRIADKIAGEKKNHRDKL